MSEAAFAAAAKAATSLPSSTTNQDKLTLYALFKQLHVRGVQHAGDVFHCLVCRVVLGSQAKTKDGGTRTDGGALFADAANRWVRRRTPPHPCGHP